MSHRLPFLALLATAFSLVAGSAWARCSQNVAGLERLGIQVASLEGLPFAAGNSPSRAIITFLGHSSYQIDTPQGVRAITDYNGVIQVSSTVGQGTTVSVRLPIRAAARAEAAAAR